MTKMPWELQKLVAFRKKHVIPNGENDAAEHKYGAQK